MLSASLNSYSVSEIRRPGRAELDRETAACGNCGHPVEVDAGFCGSCGWAVGSGSRPSGQISCPVCWAPNPPRNLHCEHCAARLGRAGPDRRHRRRGQLPRSGASVITGGFVAVLALMVVLVVVSLGRTEEPAPTTVAPPTTVTTASSASTFVGDPVGPRPLQPAQVSASSELSPEFGVANLTDGDPATVWRDAARRGEGASVTFSFADPVSVLAVVVAGIPDDVAFHTSYRIHAVKLVLGSGEVFEGEVPDSPEPFRIQVGGEETDQVTLEVITTYPSEPHSEEAGREELAIGEIEILGSPSGR